MDKSKLPKNWYIGDKRYKIKWRKPRNTKKVMEEGDEILGYCADPAAPAAERLISIDPNLETKEMCEIAIHELTHGHLWALSEDTVTEFAEDLNEFLFACFDIQKKI